MREFEIGDRVISDADPTLVGVVVARIRVRAGSDSYSYDIGYPGFEGTVQVPGHRLRLAGAVDADELLAEVDEIVAADAAVLTAPGVVDVELGTAWLDELAAIMAATVADRTPDVVLVEDVGGVRVAVVGCVMPDMDRAGDRAYLWQAVTGDFVLVPAAVTGTGRSIVGRPSGGTVVAQSTESPAAALAAARHALRQNAAA